MVQGGEPRIKLFSCLNRLIASTGKDHLLMQNKKNAPDAGGKQAMNTYQATYAERITQTGRIWHWLGSCSVPACSTVNAPWYPKRLIAYGIFRRL